MDKIRYTDIASPEWDKILQSFFAELKRWQAVIRLNNDRQIKIVINDAYKNKIRTLLTSLVQERKIQSYKLIFDIIGANHESKR